MTNDKSDFVDSRDADFSMQMSNKQQTDLLAAAMGRLRRRLMSDNCVRWRFDPSSKQVVFVPPFYLLNEFDCVPFPLFNLKFSGSCNFELLTFRWKRTQESHVGRMDLCRYLLGIK